MKANCKDCLLESGNITPICNFHQGVNFERKRIIKLIDKMNSELTSFVTDDIDSEELKRRIIGCNKEHQWDVTFANENKMAKCIKCEKVKK